MGDLEKLQKIVDEIEASSDTKLPGIWWYNGKKLKWYDNYDKFIKDYEKKIQKR